MSEMFNYRSVLAPYMRSLIEVKASAGISALRMKWILKEFDDFAVSVNLTDPHVTSEFISRWRKTRDADCDRTIYAKYSAWRQLTTLMSRRGCLCHIPRLPRQPQLNFTPYIFTKSQIADIFAACDASRLYDVRMGTSLFSMPALLRMLYGTGVRISEALSIVNEDVHLENGYIHLRKTKNGTDRIVPISESMRNVLSEYISQGQGAHCRNIRARPPLVCKGGRHIIRRQCCVPVLPQDARQMWYSVQGKSLRASSARPAAHICRSLPGPDGP